MPGRAEALQQERPLSPPDSEIATRLISAIARDRSESAFAELFDTWSGRLKRFFVCGGIDADRAEELTHDVLLTVWRRADSFDVDRASGGTWLYTLARNRRIDELRVRGRPAPRAEDLAWDGVCSPPADGAFEGAERRETLQAALDALPPEQFAVLRWTFFDGKTLSEAAGGSGLPLGTIKSRARLALARLRRVLHSGEES